MPTRSWLKSPGEGLIVAAQRGLELGLGVVVRDGGAGDLEALEADRHRFGGLARRCLGGLLGDVPVGRPVLERDQPQPRLVELDAAHDDRPATPHHASQHAGQVQDHLEVPDRGQRVALEPAFPRDREVVEAQGEVGEVPEEGEADVPPLDLGVEASVHLELRALGDPVAEEQRQDDQERQQEDDQGPHDSQDAGRSFHGSPPAGRRATIQTMI